MLDAPQPARVTLAQTLLRGLCPLELPGIRPFQASGLALPLLMFAVNPAFS